MLTLVLTRGASTVDGTFGILAGEALLMYTGELPWKEDRNGVSCIPTGHYLCTPRTTPSRGQHFILSDTKHRTYILTHSGNYCGDKELGKRCEILGCILLGMSLSKFDGQKVVTRSREAMQKLVTYTGFKPFALEIR